ncbi:MAG TPA: DHH family phosphoesterase [Candidatus Kapabacteria bacterium]|jgi:phosphoesterase RecJ-like protein|nr:DHH family phosphoesterase [Candidatus Kapabacteria bacterium]
MANDSIHYSSFIDLVRERQSFVITTHVNPDGDALGGEIGLAEWLLSIGKNVRVINHSPTPYNYLFLDQPDPIIEQFDEAKHKNAIESADLIFVLDVNDPERTRSLGHYLVHARQPVVVIDHHLEPKQFASSYFIDTEACSTGELIVKIVNHSIPILGGAISPKGAMALYVAIMTDTGSFRFPRTDSEIFRMCADLLDLGADPVRAYNEVYNTSPPSRLLLLRECLNSLEYHYDGRMALQTILQSQLEQTGAMEEDVDGFVQMPFQVKGIMLSVFLLELKEGWKISTRSKDNVSAARFAQNFGGNGHFNAAGARVHGVQSLDEMKRGIIDFAGVVLSEADVLTPQAA